MRNTIPAVRPNEGLRADYRRRLEVLIAMMHNSVIYWLTARYRSNPPANLAQDSVPAMAMRAMIRQLAKRWQKHFDELSPELAKYFAQSASKRTDSALQSMLAKHGMSVKFRMTDEMRDVMQATVGENVSLIKSIAQKYFTDVEGAVMRSVAAGRDLATLTYELGPKVDLKRIRMGRRPGESDKSLFARTHRRAALIARDQNNKMTASMTRVRQQSIGIKEAVWLHSSGGKEPRPDHVRWGRQRKRYPIDKGMWSEVEGKYIFPGELINCRCVSQSVIPGLEHRV